MYVELHLLVIVESLLVVLLLTEHVVTGGEVLAILVSVSTVCVFESGCWSDTDVLVKEFLCGKVVHEVLGSHETTLIVIPNVIEYVHGLIFKW